MSASANNPQLQLQKIIIFLLSLSPLYEMAWFAASGRYGDYPSWEIIGITGEASLIFLMITLAVPPLRRIFGWNHLLKLRRTFGLFAFFYASLHFLIYIWREDTFILAEFAMDVVKLPYVTVGFLAWLLMLPIALTASDSRMRALGRNWKKIHSMVYAVTFLTIVHYFLVRTWNPTDVLGYAALLSLLLGYRFYYARTQKE